MKAKYPVFIPSKGRWDSRLTMKAFDEIGQPYTVFVEEQEYDSYAAVIDPDNLHVLPHRDKGLTVTRNYIWDYAESLGTSYFWTFDDNTRKFWRYNRNRKLKIKTPSFLRVIEDFTERYENIVIGGMNYFMFIKQKYNNSNEGRPFSINTRVYSNMLIKTDIPFRNELFFNDDTDLCLRVLKAGYCTVLFNAFLIEKSVTMTVKGGMTDYYKQTNNRLEFAKELQRAHPDVVKIAWKWGRWQHQVDYRKFKRNKLRLKKGIEIPKGVNNYGMVLKKVG